MNANDWAAGVSASQTFTWTVDAATPPSYDSVPMLENTRVTLTTTDFGMTCCDAEVEITTPPTGGTLPTTARPSRPGSTSRAATSRAVLAGPNGICVAGNCNFASLGLNVLVDAVGGNN